MSKIEAFGGVMAEDDMLEEIERDGSGNSPEPGDAAGKKGFLGKLMSGKKKLIIIILAALLFLGGTGAGVYIFFFGGEEEPPPEQATEETVTEESIQAALEEQSKAIFEDIVMLEPFEQIALKAGSYMHFISLGISLEMMDPGFRRQVYTMEPRIRKIIENQVRQMSWADLRSAKGKLELKFMLLSRINNLFPKAAIRHIYFSNFIMQ